MVPKSIQDYLDGAAIPYATRAVPEGVEERDLAVLLGVSPQRVARAVLMFAGRERVILVVPAGAQVDPQAVERVCGCSPVRAATVDEARAAFPECEPGAAPPFGDLFELPVIVDVTLAQPGTIYLRGGTLTDVIALDYVDFSDHEDPLVAPVTFEGEELAPEFAQGALGDAAI